MQIIAHAGRGLAAVLVAPILFAVAISVPAAARGAILESAATLATIESIRSLITQAIDQATNRADYLLFISK